MAPTTIILLTTVMLLSACIRSPQQVQNNYPIDTLNTIDNGTLQKTAEIQETENTKTVPTIISFIDSLYNLQEQTTIDTITVWTVPNDQKYELGPLGLDLTDLDKYYRYFTFDFLLFKDKSSARKQFDRVAEAGSHKRLDPSDPHQVLYWKIFSKAGSAYALYENIIIYHDRRCSFVEKIEVPREDKLLDYLFNNKPPDYTYFVRVRCGWGQHDKK